VGNRTDRLHQPLGDRLADLRQLDILIAALGGRCRGRSGNLGALDVALDDAAARARAAEGREVEPALLGKAPREGRRLDAAARLAGWTGLRRRWRSRRRRCRPLLRLRGRLDRLLGLGRLRCGRTGRPAHHARDVLVRIGDHRDQLADLDGRPFARDDLAEHTLPAGLQLHDRLVGLDLGEHVAVADLVPLVFQPGQDLALLHRRGERFHEDLGHHRGLAPVSRGTRPA
jgi:hypothetical protein